MQVTKQSFKVVLIYLDTNILLRYMLLLVLAIELVEFMLDLA